MGLICVSTHYAVRLHHPEKTRKSAGWSCPSGSNSADRAAFTVLAFAKISRHAAPDRVLWAPQESLYLSHGSIRNDGLRGGQGLPILL